MNHLKLNPNLLTVPLYIGGKPIEQVQQEYGLAEVVKLASNESPLGPSPRALSALQAALTDAHRYPGVAEKQLRAKLAAYHNARDAAQFTDANFLVGNGLSDVLRMITSGFIFDGGASVVCNATFPLYKIYTIQFGGQVIAIPHKNYRYDLNAMADAITPNTRLVFVTNPNNPTGTLLTRDEVDAFMKRVPPSVVVVFDEAYHDFVDDPAYSNAVEYVKQGYENALVLYSFSKTYGLANLRLGYALGAASTIEYLAHGLLPFNTSDAVLRAGIAALDDREYLDRIRALLAREKPFLYDGLAQLDLEFIPTQANFILLPRLPRDAKTMDNEMLKRGVIIRPMGGFGLPDALRVTIGTREENVKFLHALRDVLKQ
ncbi:MAG: histidinol-phosphate transaminase [Chloroflexi bacterium]|nr:histidinol-phosphate transaminase [Chloroflexota bacterium]